MKKTRLLEIIREEINTAINEIPDFGGRYDSQVADKYGEEDTLQSATDEIVDETLKDMGVTKADLKKDADKAKEVLKLIRKKIVGKNQDPRVKDALEKQEDFDDSGNLLQANQTKALGLKEPSKRGRKASEKKEEPTTSKSEPKAKAREKDEEEKEAEAAVGTDSTAKSLGAEAERMAQVQKFMGKMKDEGVVGDDNKILDAKKYKEEFAKFKAELK
jgi:hypothetical protein